MSWTNELFQVYELNRQRTMEEGEPEMLPIAHSTAQAQVEITLDEQGGFQSARALAKADAETLIPVTEDSGSRTAGIAPMPFADKLVYLAGDYSQFVTGKRADNTEFYRAYMLQLGRWKDGVHTHRAVQALYTYLAQATMMADLIAAGILQLNSVTGKLQDKVKIEGIGQEDLFIRFVIHYKDLSLETKTWRDTSLQDAFVAFNAEMMTERGLCYATGEVTELTYKHPKKVRNPVDGAKLLSANDSSGFTFRGRFVDKEEAFAVGYLYSQKVHNALKWLIKKQGKAYDSLTVVTWASAMEPLPDVQKPLLDDGYDDDDFEGMDTAASYDSKQQYTQQLEEVVMGYREKLQPNSKIMLMGLDAASLGRLSLSMYAELESSQFFTNVMKWHSECAWSQYSFKLSKNQINSFSITELANALYGTEQGGFLKCTPEVRKETILRLLPCITEGRRIPSDMMQTLCRRASAPLTFEKGYTHRQVVEAACGVIRKTYLDYHLKGEITMAYDPNCTDRSYLYGCLLAIADKFEGEILKNDGADRPTNARRYWSAFSARPFQTWKIIEERLIPYLNKSDKGGYTNRQIQQIMDKMSPEMFADNSALSPLYLVGYHHFTAYLYTKKTNTSEEE